VKVGGHPMELVSHGLRKKKWWEGVQSYNQSTIVQINQTSQNRSHLFSMEDIKNFVASR
jgi:hypothetical protein